jgi:hypothetical protein
MLFLCIGYFDRNKMEKLSKTEIDSVIAECDVQLNKLYATNKVIIDANVESETKTLRLINSKLNVIKEKAVNSEFNVGGAFIIEAVDLEEAIQVVSLHPAAKLAVGENLGWRIEIRAASLINM